MLGKWDGKPRVGGSTTNAYTASASQRKDGRIGGGSGGQETEGNPFGAAHSG